MHAAPGHVSANATAALHCLVGHSFAIVQQCSSVDAWHVKASVDSQCEHHLAHQLPPIKGALDHNAVCAPGASAFNGDLSDSLCSSCTPFGHACLALHIQPCTGVVADVLGGRPSPRARGCLRSGACSCLLRLLLGHLLLSLCPEIYLWLLRQSLTVSFIWMCLAFCTHRMGLDSLCILAALILCLLLHNQSVTTTIFDTIIQELLCSEHCDERIDASGFS